MLVTTTNGNAFTETKALATGLISTMDRFEELTPKMEHAIKKNGSIDLTPRTLTHRFAYSSNQSGIETLLDSNTKRVVGLSDFQEERPAEKGLHLITHLSIATTNELDDSNASTLAVANYFRNIQAGDAFLQGSLLHIDVGGSTQPKITLKIGDIMTSASENQNGKNLYELPQGFYITEGQTLDLKLETPKVANGITAGKFKGIELSFVGMHSMI